MMQQKSQQQPIGKAAAIGGLPVRTNIHAGVEMTEWEAQLQAYWKQLIDAFNANNNMPKSDGANGAPSA